MRLLVALIACFTMAVPASAQNGLAADMAMGNLHNELHQRRTGLHDGRLAEPYDGATRRNGSSGESLAAYMLINWMIANNETDYPAKGEMDVYIKRGKLLVDDLPQLSSRSARYDFSSGMFERFDEMNARWRAMQDDRASRKSYSDRIWQDFSTDRGIDLRAISLDEFLLG
ncbi:MAG: hypothetical protein AAFS13_10355 [Pseudomonadota bacterium]